MVESGLDREHWVLSAAKIRVRALESKYNSGNLDVVYYGLPYRRSSPLCSLLSSFNVGSSVAMLHVTYVTCQGSHHFPFSPLCKMFPVSLSELVDRRHCYGSCYVVPFVPRPCLRLWCYPTDAFSTTVFATCHSHSSPSGIHIPRRQMCTLEVQKRPQWSWR
ncbi:hypothetical protein CPB84DRAFT_1147759 [Gymnopilus junonius]|uniref:Uncharacterized protein n=1 Tax=Gymnopilus junonius TaxID=109634 RepID=A0A9P5N922_GYMJU|nr:hypothetical protein CPB84DRAFT_1147759 [Gymnopilus junonius]